MSNFKIGDKVINIHTRNTWILDSVSLDLAQHNCHVYKKLILDNKLNRKLYPNATGYRGIDNKYLVMGNEYDEN